MRPVKAPLVQETKNSLTKISTQSKNDMYIFMCLFKRNTTTNKDTQTSSIKEQIYY